MKFKEWNEIAELIGIAALVASLLFVGLQIRQEHSIAITETRAALTESAQTIAGLVQENSEIWKRGLDGEELTANDEISFIAMVQAVRAHFFNLFLRWERFGHRDPEEVTRRYAYALYTHPGLRSAFQRQLELQILRDEAFNLPAWDDEFRNLVKSKLEQLDATSPPLPANKEYVFWK